MCPKDADRVADWVANSIDPDQTAPFEAFWSGSTLFAQICLSEKLWFLQLLYLRHKTDTRQIFRIWAMPWENLL